MLSLPATTHLQDQKKIRKRSGKDQEKIRKRSEQGGKNEEENRSMQYRNQ
jgi:hypothetical protein